MKAITNKPIPLGYINIPKGTELTYTLENNIIHCYYLGQRVIVDFKDLDIIE